MCRWFVYISGTEPCLLEDVLVSMCSMSSICLFKANRHLSTSACIKQASSRALPSKTHLPRSLRTRRANNPSRNYDSQSPLQRRWVWHGMVYTNTLNILTTHIFLSPKSQSVARPIQNYPTTSARRELPFDMQQHCLERCIRSYSRRN